MSTFSYSVIATPSTCNIEMNGAPIGAPSDFAPGLNVAVIDQTTLGILGIKTYQTGTSAAAALEFAAAMEELPVGRIVLICTLEDAFGQLSDRARQACLMLGSGIAFDLVAGDVWVLAGVKGAAPGSQVEDVSTTSASVSGQFEDQPPANGGLALQAYSAGYLVGNAAAITLNGATVAIDGGYARGLNVAVIDPESGAVTSTARFDTNSDPQASNAFAKMIAALPLGQLVAIAVLDDAQASLTADAIAAIESLGSEVIAGLAYRGSFGLIGMTGAVSGAACEMLSNVHPACACSWLQPKDPTINTFKVMATSAGYTLGDTAAIYVDDAMVLGPPDVSRGFNVAVISPSTGLVVERKTFDVYGNPGAATEMAEFISAVPPGWLVPVAVMDDGATNLSAIAKAALRSIGAGKVEGIAFRNSYSLLGVKGAAAGSVPEMLMTEAPCMSAVEYVVSPLGTTTFQHITAHSAGYLVGNTAEIQINGEPVAFTNGMARGLNVVLLNRFGQVQETLTYDTYADPSASAAFVAMIGACAEGQVVAIAVLDEATWHLSAEARAACRSLGSSLIDGLEYRNSWAMVGAKGRAPGTASEMLSAVAPVTALGWAMRIPEEAGGAWVSAQSAGYVTGDIARFFVNGAQVSMTPTRGLNVVLFDMATGVVASTASFDTNGDPAASTRFAQMIHGLAAGQGVAIAVQDEAAANLSEEAKRACRMCGSCDIDQLTYRASWAMVGAKGFAPGSAQEMLDATGATGVSLWSSILNTQSRKRFVVMGFILGACIVVALIGIVIAAIAVTPSAHPKPRGRKRAVFVGIDYTHIGSLDLSGNASKILGAFYRKMINLGHYAAGDTRLLLETSQPDTAPTITPSRSNVVDALNWLLDGAQDGDLCYFHFLGHGGNISSTSPPTQYLITLNDTLRARDVLMEADLQAILNKAPNKLNLTCVFHNCFSGGLIDTSAGGRGIGLASSIETKSTTLSLQGVNMTGALGVKLKSVAKGRVTMPTYTEMSYFINQQQGIKERSVITANSNLYNVSQLKFLQLLT